MTFHRPSPGFLGSIAVPLLALGSSLFCSAASLPLTDLIFYGKVYHKTSHAQITGTLPGKIEVKISPGDTVIASTAELKTIPGASVAEYYVIRINRFEAGTTRSLDNPFVLPGDRLRIFLNGEEVFESGATSLLVTDAPADIRHLNLNFDTDGDRLPDSWEQQFLGNLAGGMNDDSNSDGVSNFLAYALGLDPRMNNASKMPFLQIEQGGNLVFYFRQSADASEIANHVEASDSLSGSSWNDLLGVTPQKIGQEGNSLLFKVVVPGGVDRPTRFFRLSVE
jgi:hypothetical protein